jgi:hypothetical protein
MMVAVIFWGCSGASIVLSVLGLVKRSPPLLFLAAAFATPLALYLTATPRFRTVGLLIPVPQLLSGLVVRRAPWLAIVLASFFPCFVAWLEILVYASNQQAAA